MPLPPNPGETASQYAQQLDQEYPGKGAGASYLKFANAHPGLTALQAGDAWALSIGLAQFGTGLSGAVGGTGTAIGQIATGSEKGAAQVSKQLSWTDSIGNFFNLLTSRQTLVRLVEGIIGAALIIVAIDHMTTNSSSVGKVSHTVAKAALLA